MSLPKINIKTIIFVLACAVAGAIGGLLFQTYPGVSTILIICSLFGVAWTFIVDELRHRDTEGFMRDMAEIFIRKDIGNPYVERVLAQIQKTGRCEDGVVYLQKSLHANPKDPQVTALLASVLAFNLSGYQAVSHPRPVPKDLLVDAERHANRALKIAPDNYMSYDAMGVLCDIKGDHQKARQFFRKGAQHGSPGWHTLMSTSWGKSGNHNEALEEIESQIKEGVPDVWMIDFFHGRALMGVGRYSEGLESLKKAYAKQGLMFELLLFIHEAYYMQGFLSRAVWYESLASLVALPRSMRTSFRLATKSAIHLLTAIVAKISRLMWPFVGRVPGLSSICLLICSPAEPEATLSVMLCECGHYELARQHLEKATRILPNVATHWANLGACLMALGHFQAAAEAMDRSLSLEPDNEIWRFIRDTYLALHEGQKLPKVPESLKAKSRKGRRYFWRMFHAGNLVRDQRDADNIAQNQPSDRSH